MHPFLGKPLFGPAKAKESFFTEAIIPDSKNRRSNCPSQSVLISTHGNTEVQIVVKEICRQASGSFLMATGVQNVMRLFVRSYNL